MSWYQRNRGYLWGSIVACCVIPNAFQRQWAFAVFDLALAGIIVWYWQFGPGWREARMKAVTRAEEAEILKSLDKTTTGRWPTQQVALPDDMDWLAEHQAEAPECGLCKQYGWDRPR